MTVGLPGSGIGGLFYLASALWMPVHSVLERVRARVRPRDHRLPDSRVMARQFGIAVTIIAALWTMGWLIALVVVSHPESLGTLAPEVSRKGIPNVLGVAAFYLSLGTLTAVLGSVQVARLVANPRFSWRKQVAAAAAGSLIILFAPRVLAQDSSAVAKDSSPPPPAIAKVEISHLAAAESAYVAGNTETAQHEYELVLADDPGNGRALFRLGELAKNDPHRAEELLRRYVAVEPTDAWGHMALGDALARSGKYADAVAQYDSALKIVPADRDANVGRARLLIRQGHTYDAIAALRKWTSAHSDDAEAARLLAEQRRRAGLIAPPSFLMSTSGSTDSDQNKSFRAGALAGATVGDGVRAELYGGRKRITGFSDVTVTDGGAGVRVKPDAAWQVETSIGVMHPVEADTITVATNVTRSPFDANLRYTTVPGNGRGRGRRPGGGDTSSIGQPPPGTIVNPEQVRNVTYVVGSARARWRQPGGLGLVDLRATRTALDANTLLLINRVVRNEVLGRADIPITNRLRARTSGRYALYDAVDETNNRTAILGGLAYAATKAIEVSTVFQNLAFSHATNRGYFAPRVAQLAEAGWYAEFESENGAILALDGGGGIQRQAAFGADIGNWKPAFRLYALGTIPLGTAGSELRLEIDSYDSRLGSEAATSSSWRYASGSLSIRLALR